MILADIDRFKVVNDRYGHQAGDAVLVELAARLKNAVRGMDLVCRYGGEEFAVILPGASVLDVASIAERLRVSVRESNMEAGGGPGLEDGLEITISLGGAVYDRDTEKVLNSPELLVKAADQALYVAKDSGRNCVRVFRIDGRAAA